MSPHHIPTNRSMKKISGKSFVMLIAIGIGFQAPSPVQAADEVLFTSSVFVKAGLFTKSIEGPGCDADGNLYAVSFNRQGTIGKVTPSGEASIFVELPTGSVANGIRFDSKGRMLIADYTMHNVLAVDMTTRAVTVYAHESSMSQPNDLAIGTNDIVYASDPNWTKSTGRIWRIGTDGAVTLLDSGLGTTNGIEVSPDDRTLYVNESSQNNVFAYDLSPSGEISNKRLLINLPATSLDGMRCDIAGNLYLTRKNKTGTIAIVSPQGTLLREVKLSGSSPSNIAFGGPDGRTCYVTMANDGSIETFRTDTPGRSWKLFEDRKPTLVAGSLNTPKPFGIAGTHPNPFNASTVIEYRLAADAPVDLSIYNMIGQRVAVLENGPVYAGKHAVTWNAAGFSSGTYVVRLISGGKAETRKVMLVK